MKILHTSDWHLGASFRGNSFAEDQVFFINEIKDIIVKENIDAMIIAGDVFDRSIASEEAIKIYDEAMSSICGDMDIPVLILAGNHDGASRLSSCNRLLKKSGLFIAGSLQKEPFVWEKDNVSVYLLPWISTEKVRAVFPEKAEKINNLEDAYKCVCDSVKANFKPGNKNILAAHSFISNADLSESDRAAIVGSAACVSVGVFEGFDYVALGHIHKPQDITDKVRYSGTPWVMSFGKEEKQIKSVTVFDTETCTKTEIPIKSLRKRITLHDTWEEIVSGKYTAEERDAYIRAEITDRVLTIDIMSKLSELFPNFLEASGKTIEALNVGATMTLDDSEKEKSNPAEIFRQYCIDNCSEGFYNEHLAELFEKAVEKCEKEESEE